MMRYGVGCIVVFCVSVALGQTHPAGTVPTTFEALTASFCLRQAMQAADAVAPETRGDIQTGITVGWYIAGDPTTADHMARLLSRNQRDAVYLQLARQYSWHHKIAEALRVAKLITAESDQSSAYSQITATQAMLGNSDSANDTLQLIKSPDVRAWTREYTVAARCVWTDADPVVVLKELGVGAIRQNQLMIAIARGKADRGNDKAALAIAQSIRDPGQRALAYLGVAGACRRLGRREVCSLTVDLAVAAAGEVTETAMKIDTYLSIAREQVDCGDMASATKMVEAVDVLMAHAVGNADPTNEMIHTGLMLTRVCLRLGAEDLAGAERIAEQWDGGLEPVAAAIVDRGRWEELQRWVTSLANPAHRAKVWIAAAETVTKNELGKGETGQ